MKRDHGIILMANFADTAIRIVTHRDVSRADIEYMVQKLREIIAAHK